MATLFRMIPSGRDVRLLLLMFFLSLLVPMQVGAAAADSIASSPAQKTSKWVNTRSDNYRSVMLSVWSDINLHRCLADYRVVKARMADSLEANKKPDETISFYSPHMFTLTYMVDYQRFRPEGYSSRLTIYFYAAAALFLLMLVGWLVMSFVISPFNK